MIRQLSKWSIFKSWCEFDIIFLFVMWTTTIYVKYDLEVGARETTFLFNLHLKKQNMLFKLIKMVASPKKKGFESDCTNILVSVLIRKEIKSYSDNF